MAERRHVSPCDVREELASEDQGLIGFHVFFFIVPLTRAPVENLARQNLDICRDRYLYL
jgi:hypothetical protein